MIQKKLVFRNNACLTHRLEEFADPSAVSKYQTWECAKCVPKIIQFKSAQYTF